MKYTGLLLKESLRDEAVLSEMTVIRTEIWDVKNAVAGQPRQWTAVHFEVAEEKVVVVARELSKSLKPAWYLNMSGESNVFVIFHDKVFKYQKGDVVRRSEVILYGKNEGIPEHQLDWKE
ncbi:MAG: hypothetical protein V1652_02910 [bacterium]